jgi:glucose/arabinose dehydrogenase
MSKLFLGTLAVLGVASAMAAEGTEAKQSVYTDFRGQSPGAIHKITPADLPVPYVSKSALNHASLVPRPKNAWPQAAPGFKVELYAEGLNNPRLIRTAPNGDLFVAESRPGRIKVFRGITPDGKPEESSVFANGLTQPFGIAFYPLGPNPQYVYVANTDSVVRFAYKNGDLRASGSPQKLVGLPGGVS